MLDLRKNFKTEEISTVCRRCKIGEETQEHLYSCQDLITDVIIQTSSVLNYHDLLGTNVEMVEKIIEPYYK